MPVNPKEALGDKVEKMKAKVVSFCTVIDGALKANFDGSQALDAFRGVGCR